MTGNVRDPDGHACNARNAAEDRREYPTLDDRNSASVVGVPWNENGYADNTHAASRSYVTMRQRRDDARDVGMWLGAIGAPADVIASQERVLEALESGVVPDLSAARSVVERYGRMWAKDTDYYAAAEVLGINEADCA